jgi:hypothetical protein
MRGALWFGNEPESGPGEDGEGQVERPRSRSERRNPCCRYPGPGDPEEHTNHERRAAGRPAGQDRCSGAVRVRPGCAVRSSFAGSPGVKTRAVQTTRSLKPLKRKARVARLRRCHGGCARRPFRLRPSSRGRGGASSLQGRAVKTSALGSQVAAAGPRAGRVGPSGPAALVPSGGGALWSPLGGAAGRPHRRGGR